MVRVAVVGAGWWGQQHARAFAARRDVELVAIWSRSEDRAVKRAARFGARPFTDLQSMIAEAKPDLISVCLPNQDHYATTMAVIDAGIPLVVEKPLVFELEDADALLAAARERDLFFAICFNHRYARAAELARAAVDDGRLGDLVLVTWRFGGEGATDHPFNNLIETQCHGIDMLEWLAGPISSVSAQLGDRGRPGVHSNVALALAFESGAVGTLAGSYSDSYGHPGAHVLELVGTSGRVLVEDTVRRYSYSPHGSETAEVWEPGYFNDRDRQFQLTMDTYVADLLEAFAAGNPPPVSATAGRRALAVAHAAIESFKTRRTIDITRFEA